MALDARFVARISGLPRQPLGMRGKLASRTSALQQIDGIVHRLPDRQQRVCVKKVAELLKAIGEIPGPLWPGALAARAPASSQLQRRRPRGPKPLIQKAKPN